MGNSKEIKQLRIREYKYDSETGIFEGYASVFGNVDSDNDVVEKGAFAKFLAKGWDRVVILMLHNDEWLPIGKPVELYEDDIGLYIKAKISATSMGSDARILMQDGVLSELSIGYITHDCYVDEKHIRHLTELELLEVSVVTWAANEQARILDVKSLTKNLQGPEELLALAGALEQSAAAIRAQVAVSNKPPAGGKAKKTRLAYTLPAELKSVQGRRRKKHRSRQAGL